LVHRGLGDLAFVPPPPVVKLDTLPSSLSMLLLSSTPSKGDHFLTTFAYLGTPLISQSSFRQNARFLCLSPAGSLSPSPCFSFPPHLTCGGDICDACLVFEYQILSRCVSPPPSVSYFSLRFLSPLQVLWETLSFHRIGFKPSGGAFFCFLLRAITSLSFGSGVLVLL